MGLVDDAHAATAQLAADLAKAEVAAMAPRGKASGALWLLAASVDGAEPPVLRP